LVYPPAQKIISIFSIRGAPCTIEGVLQHDEDYQQHEVMTTRNSCGSGHEICEAARLIPDETAEKFECSCFL